MTICETQGGDRRDVAYKFSARNLRQGYPYIFCLLISPARYSDARIDNARMVIVGFCHPALVKLAPSTTNRFLWSWLWHHLFNTLRFESSPIRQVPTSWML